jgi:hypothetical protein
MLTQSRLRALAALTFAAFLCAAPGAATAQKKSKKPMPRGTPVLWREREVERLDLSAGPGGEAMRPDVRRLRVLKEEAGGFSPKYRVRDARGRVWVAKLGSEAQSETAATRLVWAAGYITETTYLVPCVRLEGITKPKKEIERCAGGGFANVRFEARPAGVERLDPWKWKENPFRGTLHLQGLKVLMALLNNWDMKDDNNVIIHAPGGRGGRGELRYAISDLGATFGKTGSLPLFWRITRSRNKPEDYAESKFIDEVEGGRVDFHFGGKNRGLLDDVTVAEARWVGRILSRLSNRQLADAFRAANYTPEETAMLAEAVRSRIDELVNLRVRRKGAR